MMGFCKIFFLDGPFWRFLGIEDRFFFFCSSRPISCDPECVWGYRSGGLKGGSCREAHLPKVLANLSAVGALVLSIGGPPNLA